jgi:hypothetical protein
VARVSFQLSILKILAGQPDGRGNLELIKLHLAVFYTSGPEWTLRMKRLAELAPDLDAFSQGLISRERGAWTITNQGRDFLAKLEEAALGATPATRPPDPAEPVEVEQASPIAPPAAASPPKVLERSHGRPQGKHRKNHRKRSA